MQEEVNRVLASRPAVSRLVARGGRYLRILEPVRPSSLHFLVPIAESAAWLLEHGDPALVRRCGGPDCVLFFYDTSKNHSRRWCSMDACGGRAKAGAYYRRRHPPAG
jgi:predicted RNA-binding Zn ribbon-like protein